MCLQVESNGVLDQLVRKWTTEIDQCAASAEVNICNPFVCAAPDARQALISNQLKHGAGDATKSLRQSSLTPRLLTLAMLVAGGHQSARCAVVGGPVLYAAAGDDTCTVYCRHRALLCSVSQAVAAAAPATSACCSGRCVHKLRRVRRQRWPPDLTFLHHCTLQHVRGWL
jgi:hypothetical protein